MLHSFHSETPRKPQILLRFGLSFLLPPFSLSSVCRVCLRVRASKRIIRITNLTYGTPSVCSTHAPNQSGTHLLPLQSLNNSNFTYAIRFFLCISADSYYNLGNFIAKLRQQYRKAPQREHI